MLKQISIFLIVSCYSLIFLSACSHENRIDIANLNSNIYPEVNPVKPNLPSPFVSPDDDEYVIAVTKEHQYAIIPVTLSNDRDICKQLIVDAADFPSLAQTGLHDEKELGEIKTITGRSLSKITELGRPGRYSQGGFMAEDEDIISVMTADNRLVERMDLTHPDLAKPLFHVLNMMDTDLSLNRWNMAKHQWENIQYFYYNDCVVYVEAHDTKGGQESIFDDNIEGAFYIRLWREFDKKEIQFLEQNYSHLSAGGLDTLKTMLSSFNTGEIQPQYIMRYGFYEGHTFWRADPVAISFIFGLRSLSELEETFEGELYDILTDHFTGN
jgi:hypothetical protein